MVQASGLVMTLPVVAVDGVEGTPNRRIRPDRVNDGRQETLHQGLLSQTWMRHPNAYQESLSISKPAQNPMSQHHANRYGLSMWC